MNEKYNEMLANMKFSPKRRSVTVLFLKIKSTINSLQECPQTSDCQTEI